jgi:hypothetical protein
VVVIADSTAPRALFLVRGCCSHWHSVLLVLAGSWHG